MDEIPYWFWMIIVTGLSGMLGFIMYYLALLLRETMLTVREFKYLVVEFHDVLDSAKVLMEKMNRVSDTMTRTVETVSSSILQPLAAIGSWINSLRSMISSFTGDVVEDEYDDEFVG